MKIVFIAFLVLIVLLFVLTQRRCGSSKTSKTSKTPKTSKTRKTPEDKLRVLHQQLRLKYGSFDDEFPEQVMAVEYIGKDDVVLELGGNIGRNSLIIATLLRDDRYLMTLETDPNICMQLAENRELNDQSFQIVNAALSARPLIQSGWVTQPWDGRDDGMIPDGFQPVSCMTFDQLQRMMPKPFTTLVADCEGALFYILQDFPEMLRSFRTVIMENDYMDLSHKQTVDSILSRNGFQCVYRQAGGWGPCEPFFFEVWQKR